MCAAWALPSMRPVALTDTESVLATASYVNFAEPAGRWPGCGGGVVVRVCAVDPAGLGLMSPQETGV